jgi:hypothetical protein
VVLDFRFGVLAKRVISKTHTAANEEGAVGLDTVLKPPVRGPPTSGGCARG